MPPKAIDDRRNRGEQLGEERERLPQPCRTQFREKDRDAERNRGRQRQCENRRVQRAPDKGTCAKLAGNRVPDIVDPEGEAELCDGELGWSPHPPPDRHDQQDEAERDRPCHEPESQVLSRERSLHDTLMVLSASIYSLTTSAGRGAEAR